MDLDAIIIATGAAASVGPPSRLTARERRCRYRLNGQQTQTEDRAAERGTHTPSVSFRHALVLCCTTMINRLAG